MGQDKKNFEIIPAIDIIEGKCVRLTHGDYSQKKIYNEDPLEVARQFEDAGLTRLHLVDLDGAKAGAVKNWKVLETIAGKTSLSIDFGGGIHTEKDIHIIFDCGAKLATVGSMAVKEPEVFKQWISLFGADHFFLGADVKNERITISGWTKDTGIYVYDFIREHMELGISQVFCTDVSKDGALEGPATTLYSQVVKEFPSLHFIASGGVSSIDDLYRLQEAGCRGVIIGKAIYEGRISLKELVKLDR